MPIVERDIFDIRTKAPGPGGKLPLTPEMLHRPPERRHLWSHAECGHGLEPERTGAQTIPDSQHARWHARAGWLADRARLSHGALGNFAASAGGGGGVSRVEGDSVRGVLLGPVRWAHAGNGRDVRQPAVSQRCGDFVSPAGAFAADALGSHGRGDVRQRFAGDDDGAGGPARSADGSGAGRRDVAAGDGRRRGRGANDRRAVRARDVDAR